MIIITTTQFRDAMLGIDLHPLLELPTLLERKQAIFRDEILAFSRIEPKKPVKSLLSTCKVALLKKSDKYKCNYIQLVDDVDLNDANIIKVLGIVISD